MLLNDNFKIYNIKRKIFIKFYLNYLKNIILIIIFKIFLVSILFTYFYLIVNYIKLVSISIFILLLKSKNFLFKVIY